MIVIDEAMSFLIYDNDKIELILLSYDKNILVSITFLPYKLCISLIII